MQCWRRRPNPRCARASAYVSPLAGGIRRDCDALGPRDRDRRAHRPTADRSPAFAGACWSDRVREAAPGQSCRHHGSSRRRRRAGGLPPRPGRAARPRGRPNRIGSSGRVRAPCRLQIQPLPAAQPSASGSTSARRVLSSTPRHILLLEPPEGPLQEQTIQLLHASTQYGAGHTLIKKVQTGVVRRRRTRPTLTEVNAPRFRSTAPPGASASELPKLYSTQPQINHAGQACRAGRRGPMHTKGGVSP